MAWRGLVVVRSKMRTKLNPLTYVVLAIVLAGLLWMFLYWQPSAAIISATPMPELDAIWPNVNIPEVRNG